MTDTAAHLVDRVLSGVSGCCIRQWALSLPLRHRLAWEVTLASQVLELFRLHYMGSRSIENHSPECFPDDCETTPDNNPAHIYHKILVAIDETRELLTGEPRPCEVPRRPLDMSE